MASADLRDELECSICLDFYKDPVTLKCGHNFCRNCIGGMLDIQNRSGSYSCPECKQRFKGRPALQRNLKLCNIVENFVSSQSLQKETRIFCTYCIHAPVPAVKSCLHCEASLCGNHLTVHSKSPEHVLCDPTTSLENRKCSVHKELLKYYCTEDAACICVSCSLAGEHRGHQVETLEVASEMKKKTLRNGLQTLMTKKRETEKRVQSLQEHTGKVQGKAAGETERVTALFRDLRRQLEDLEKRVLSEMSRQVKRVSHTLSEEIQKLEIKKDELSKKMGHIEEMCNKSDPMTILQESDIGDLCYTEDEERHDKLLHDGGDLDVAEIKKILHTGLSYIMSGVLVHECQDTHVYPHCSAKKRARIADEVAGPSTQPTATVQPSHRQVEGPEIGVKQQTSRMSGVTGIFLDVSTAGNDLHLSEDKKTASWSDDRQYRPETTERFQYSQVLSKQSFSSGRHYWEVDVTGSECWRVGMCYPSIDRRGWPQSGIGYNKKSWGLERLWNNQHFVIHDEKRVPLSSKVSSNRVRIDLDYEAGRISFYDLCDPIQHLHTFTATFTEPLHAGLYVLGGGIKISGGNQK
ncbi:PREDICTED: E3 ubiquitin/ISG15 ligase TRIM25-like [Nanorana parkeri]|uniref:E3 ubiquitin/ISG15 ligase TRIM25-like n=1 Tax=Nanorana parkeri TaxID=125878 RepID=UPI00085444A6|nr:PREDICTED: E3 ubiquitin/ISG15 ligase TRIM25-like [Nanorana parkeri]